MTPQPAGEHHTGTLNLAGQGNPAPSQISDDAVAAAARKFFGRAYGSVGDEGNKLLHDGAREALEAAYPAIRQQVAEQIATRADQIAQGFQDTAVAHRDLSNEHGRTLKGTSHMTTAHAYRNKADGAWAVAHDAREFGGEA